jgi:hypothetical protein
MAYHIVDVQVSGVARPPMKRQRKAKPS